MIDWEHIRPKLLDIVGNASGLKTFWLDKKRPYVDPKNQAAVYLRPRTSAGEGVDDRRVKQDLTTPGSEITFTQTGFRVVGLEVRVESFRQDDDRFAFNAADKVHTAMRFPSVLAAFRSVNCALVDVGDVNDLGNVMVDERVVSTAVFEISVRMVVAADDPLKTTYIEKCVPVGTLT